ncbi:MAG TPA: sialidase family protein, partial [Ignavibacteriaceae bacterium]
MAQNRSTIQDQNRKRRNVAKSLVINISIFFILFLAGAVFAQSDNLQQIPAMKEGIRENYSQSDYENFLLREKLGEIPFQGGLVDQQAAADALVNNNTGSTGTANFTQSEMSIIAFGNNVVIGFNDSGSYTGGANKFTGYSYSTDGGATFIDGGTLPTSTVGDAGDPVLARNEITGRIYFCTLGFSGSGTIQVFRSDDNGLTYSAPVNGTPGGSSEDKQWIVVDNYAGTGNGNVYLISRRFGGSPGIYMFRSTDNGNTFGPSGGVNIFSGGQGAFVAVGPDHSVYAFYYNGSTSIQVRKSTDLGVTFGAAVTIFNGLAGGTNGDLNLTGIRQGTASASYFRSNSFPHAAVNPVSGYIYVTFNDNPAGTDRADVYMTISTDGGATWSARTLVNDDATTTDQWQPTIAVTPNGNNIGIFYYSRQEDVANNLLKYYGRIGVISGSSVNFDPGFAISDVASLPEFGRDNVV